MAKTIILGDGKFAIGVLPGENSIAVSIQPLPEALKIGSLIPEDLDRKIDQDNTYIVFKNLESALVVEHFLLKAIEYLKDQGGVNDHEG